MTQPAKVPEPSMEEILASIRRIIADDEAKPPAAEKSAGPAAAPAKPAAPAAKAPVMNDIPPSAIPAAKAAAAKAATPPPKPAPPPAAGASNGQDDIDALLAGLDEATSEAEIRPAPPEEVEEVFELTDEMAVAAPEPEPAFRKVEPQDDVEFTETASARALHRQPAYDPPSYDSPAAPPPQQMLSHSTVSAVESAFHTLANTVLSNNARTLEDLVKEMLRPMLKSWLDDNLPGLVERIVKAEIERVSRGGR
jgi:cell pole-organizing protein PopZ